MSKAASPIFLKAQVAWLLLSALWNVSGVALIHMGERAIGPTASLPLAVILLIAAAALIWAWRRFNIVYLLLSLLAIWAAGSAVLNAFVADPALWPSEFWRLAGAALNSFGVISSVAGGIFAIKRLATKTPSNE